MDLFIQGFVMDAASFRVMGEAGGGGGGSHRSRQPTFTKALRRPSEKHEPWNAVSYIDRAADTKRVWLAAETRVRKVPGLLLSTCVRLNWKQPTAGRLLVLFACQTAFVMTAFPGEVLPQKEEEEKVVGWEGGGDGGQFPSTK